MSGTLTAAAILGGGAVAAAFMTSAISQSGHPQIDAEEAQRAQVENQQHFQM